MKSIGPFRIYFQSNDKTYSTDVYNFFSTTMAFYTRYTEQPLIYFDNCGFREQYLV